MAVRLSLTDKQAEHLVEAFDYHMDTDAMPKPIADAVTGVRLQISNEFRSRNKKK